MYDCLPPSLHGLSLHASAWSWYVWLRLSYCRAIATQGQKGGGLHPSIARVASFAPSPLANGSSYSITVGSSGCALDDHEP